MAKDTKPYKAGDKVQLIETSAGKKKPVRIGDTVTPGYFTAVLNGRPGAIKYGRVYQVSAIDDIDIVDNEQKPVPFISKEFVNHPVFKTLFRGVKPPDKTKKQ